MKSPGGGVSNSILHVRGNAHFLRLAIILAFGITTALMAFATAGQPTAHAAGLDEPGQIQSLHASNGDLPALSGGNSDEGIGNNPKLISPMDPTVIGERGSAGCGRPPKPIIPIPQEDEIVWEANLTVGVASDSTITYLGYAPPLSPDGGDLDVTTFSHDGVDYTVRGIYLQESIGGFRQLIFDGGARLPEDLFLEVGDDQFLVSESNLYGLNQNFHGWVMDESLGWTEGQVIEVALMQPAE